MALLQRTRLPRALPRSSLLVAASTALSLLAVSSAQAQLQCTSSPSDVTCTNSGTIGNGSVNSAFRAGPGTANFTNSGTIGSGSSNQAFVNGSGAATFTNTGSIGSGSASQAFVNGAGTATFSNSGTIGDAGSTQAFVNGPGTANYTNSGTVGAGGGHQAFVNGPGNANFTNFGTFGGPTSLSAFVNGNGNATFSNFGTIGAGGTAQAFVGGNGTATFNNYGTASAVSVGGGTAILTSYAGSRIVGPISLSGSTKILEFVGGNYLYTLSSMAGVTVNSHGAPFVVSGNTVAVLDPTVLALEDRSLMNFTGGISSMLQDRFGGMSIPGGMSAAAPLSFAPDRLGVATDAFAGMPSLSMSYSSEGSRARNANAMYTKAPAALAPVNDITVWTSGFGGQRWQDRYDIIQRARDAAYGGAIGIDRQFTPALRLGVFAGAGSSMLRTDFNVQSVDSDYGFGGAYGRYDMRNYFVDFALFGGGISSRSTRLVANNLVASGVENAIASYNGWFISPDVTFGYRVFNAFGTITPKARVRYVGGSLDGYTETGSAQGLSMGKRDISDVEERLGVEFANIVGVAGGGTLRASVEFSGVGLQRLGDNNINAVLLAQNIAFTTPGRSQAFGGAVGGGLDWRPKGTVSVYVSAEGAAMDDKSYSYVAKGGMRVGF